MKKKCRFFSSFTWYRAIFFSALLSHFSSVMKRRENGNINLSLCKKKRFASFPLPEWDIRYMGSWGKKKWQNVKLKGMHLFLRRPEESNKIALSETTWISLALPLKRMFSWRDLITIPKHVSKDLVFQDFLKLFRHREILKKNLRKR